MGRIISWPDLLSLCLRHAHRLSTKLKAITDSGNSTASCSTDSGSTASKRRFMKLVKWKNRKKREEGGGVWQRTILMGDKCQPLAFSGVIYYDSNGKQLAELPLRSPRASPYN